MSTYDRLPPDLPVPHDDGAADHLAGRALPSQNLANTSGHVVDLARLTGRIVVYVYPMTRHPGVAQPDGWDAIPGARGCTPESCGFRDHHQDLLAAGAAAVYGLSSQLTEEQQEAADRLHLPFDLLSDPDFAWAHALRMPTFTADGRPFHCRLTLIVDDGRIRHVFYPVFPPDAHASEVVRWLAAHPTH